jgi:hypothetical protein
MPPNCTNRISRSITKRPDSWPEKVSATFEGKLKNISSRMIALLYINLGILRCFALYFFAPEIIGLECMLIDGFLDKIKEKYFFP